MQAISDFAAGDIMEMAVATTGAFRCAKLQLVRRRRSDLFRLLMYDNGRAGFSWWEAWGQAYLGVTRCKTVKALEFKIQD